MSSSTPELRLRPVRPQLSRVTEDRDEEGEGWDKGGETLRRSA